MLPFYGVVSFMEWLETHFEVAPTVRATVLVSIALWTLVYLVSLPLIPTVAPSYRALTTEKDRVEFRMRCISIVHAAWAALHGINCLLLDPMHTMFKESLMGPNRYEANLHVAFSLGYFLYDFVVTLRHHKYLGDMATYVHHISVSFAFVFVMTSDKACHICCMFLANEVSGPFLHFRWFLRLWKMRGTALEELNALLLVGSYFLCRIVLSAWVAYICFYIQPFLWLGWWDCTIMDLLQIEILLLPLIAQLCMNIMWFKKVYKLSSTVRRLFGLDKRAVVCEVRTVVSEKVRETVDRGMEAVNSGITTVDGLREMTVDTVDGLRQSAADTVAHTRDTVDGLRQSAVDTVAHTRAAITENCKPVVDMVEIVQDSRADKPKTERGAQLQRTWTVCSWVVAVCVLCYSSATRWKSYDDVVFYLCFSGALFLIVMGLYLLSFGSNDKEGKDAAATYEDPVKPQADGGASVACAAGVGADKLKAQ